jgi:hypothetical protein
MMNRANDKWWQRWRAEHDVKVSDVRLSAKAKADLMLYACSAARELAWSGTAAERRDAIASACRVIVLLIASFGRRMPRYAARRIAEWVRELRAAEERATVVEVQERRRARG